MKRAGRFPRAVAIATRLAYANAKSSGTAVGPLLASTRLSRRLIEDPKSRLRVVDQIEFLNLVSNATGDGLLGFHLAQRCELREAGLFYYVLASSGTLFDVCARTARYSSMLNEGVMQNFIDGRAIGIGLRYSGFSRHRDQHQAEFWFTALLRFVRQLSGTSLVPQRVRMAHGRSEGAREMSTYFGCQVEFGATVDEIVFARKFGELPLVNADPFLNQLLVAMCEEALAKRGPVRGSIRTQVENAIATSLPHGNARASLIAKGLGLSQRTLARHLTHEGTTYSGVLNGMRRDLASRYLEDDSLSISQIAWLLGFQDVGAFSHAFKRWTGSTPRQAAARVR
jgi:AraC-like DNA-binding protein